MSPRYPCVCCGHLTDAGVLAHVRSPTDAEPLDAGWRPIDPRRDEFEPRGRALAPWPADLTELYWWRRHPGTAPWYRRG